MLFRSLKTAKEQDRWAKTAEVEKLTPNDLNRSIAANAVVRGSDERSSGIFTLAAWVTEFEVWKRSLDDGWRGDQTWCSKVREQIKPVIEFVDIVKAKE